MNYFLPSLYILLCVGLGIGFPQATKAMNNGEQNWFVHQINTPSNLTHSTNDKIVVAIVDDGIRTSHNSIRPFIWKNPFEIADNSVDDDGNGFVDDVYGWDVADNNNLVTPPVSRADTYYHGTHLAGIVTRIVQAAYGPKATEAVAIMAVKSLSDAATNTAIKNGYEGIEYAVNAGADIILCAWSVGHISIKEEKILKKAKNKGVLVIASAGNFPDEQDRYPAADSSTFAVAALNSDNRISSKSNYGTFVDLSAPGVDIVSASSISDEAFVTREGTSQAAAIVAGAAAVLMARSPTTPVEKIKACLKNGSTLLQPMLSEYTAKQGAGMVNIKDAIACLDAPAVGGRKHFHPQGYLRSSLKKGEKAFWIIEPVGKFKGIWLYRPEVEGTFGQMRIEIYSGNASVKGKLLANLTLDSMGDKFFVPDAKATVRITNEIAGNDEVKLLLEYRAESIKFRTLYCRDTIYLTKPGSFEDGSGASTYSANSDCKWQITAPKGKVVQFNFQKFDTEPNTDLLYFFHGSGSHELIMAVFNGTKIPPELTSWGNEVLVWFVTNASIQRDGWKTEFTFVDQEEAKYPSPQNN